MVGLDFACFKEINTFASLEREKMVCLLDCLMVSLQFVISYQCLKILIESFMFYALCFNYDIDF